MTTFDPTRRALLCGNRDRRSFFPPWARDTFTSICTRCGDCIERCETGVLIKGDGGFPEVDFDRAGCSFCEACVTACSQLAFKLPSESPPWHLTAQLTGTCLASSGITCRACEESCEVQAISFRLLVGGRSRFQIDAAACNGCGTCYSVCPPRAISLTEAT